MALPAPPADTAYRSRLNVIQPDYDYASGTGLHDLLRDAYILLGDNLNTRFFTVDALGAGGTVDFIHYFKTSFAYLSFQLYLRNTGTGELTRLVSGSTPNLDDFTITPTPSYETTEVRVTNNSGASRDLALLVYHGAAIQTPRYINNTYTAKANDVIHADSSSSGFTVTLPPAADCVPGHRIEIMDAAGTFHTGNIVLDRNGQNINGAAANWTLDVQYSRTIIEYINATLDWRTFSS